MIEADKRHLTSEIAPRIENALQKLEAMGVIGKQQRLTTVDTTRARWGKEWLTAQWEILPPLHLIQAYQAAATPPKRSGKRRLPEANRHPTIPLLHRKRTPVTFHSVGKRNRYLNSTKVLDRTPSGFRAILSV